MLREIEFYHGAALARLVRASRTPIEFELLRWDRSFNAYLVNRRIGLYLKYSTHRLAPWQFVFTHEQRKEVVELVRRTKQMVVGLVCWEDGIVALTNQEVGQLIDLEGTGTTWIRVSRKKRGQYKVHGPSGELRRRVSQSDLAASFGLCDPKEGTPEPIDIEVEE